MNKKQSEQADKILDLLSKMEDISKNITKICHDIEDKIDNNKRKLIKKLQANCMHPNTKVELDENLHRNETWKITTCVVGNKELSRE